MTIFIIISTALSKKGPDGSRAYDAFTGTFLTPAWKEMSRNVLDPLRLRLYRYPYNDPINNRRKLAFRGNNALVSFFTTAVIVKKNAR